MSAYGTSGHAGWPSQVRAAELAIESWPAPRWVRIHRRERFIPSVTCQRKVCAGVGLFDLVSYVEVEAALVLIVLALAAFWKFAYTQIRFRSCLIS